MESVEVIIKLAREGKSYLEDDVKGKNGFCFETHTTWESVKVLIKKNHSLGKICAKVVNVGHINL